MGLARQESARQGRKAYGKAGQPKARQVSARQCKERQRKEKQISAEQGEECSVEQGGSARQGWASEDNAGQLRAKRGRGRVTLGKEEQVSIKQVRGASIRAAQGNSR